MENTELAGWPDTRIAAAIFTGIVTMTIVAAAIIAVLGLSAPALAALPHERLSHPDGESATLPPSGLDAISSSHRRPAAAPRSLPPAKIQMGGAIIDVSFAPGKFALPQPRLLVWISDAARAVSAYYGRFPVTHAHINVIPMAGRKGVLGGRSWTDHGVFTNVRVGEQTRASALNGDWVMTHEMVHYAFPTMAREHHWIEEGLATYVEPIARLEAGELSAQTVWSQMIDGMPNGLPAAGDEGLDHTHTWGRTYWGGALFCLIADIRIRAATHNRHGLRDALRGIIAAGGNMETSWPIERALKAGDRAVGVPVLEQLYERMKAAPVSPDLAALWLKLGVEPHGDTVVFHNGAPMARVRRAIASNPARPAAPALSHKGAGIPIGG